MDIHQIHQKIYRLNYLLNKNALPSSVNQVKSIIATLRARRLRARAQF